MASEGTGTHKDPVTGELISKSYVSRLAGCHRGVEHDRMSNRELKRREKQREREARKAEKAAPAAQDGTANAPNEDDLNPNVSHPSLITSLSETSILFSNTLNFAPGRS
jgi:lysyl-tRNA synthetase class 2